MTTSKKLIFSIFRDIKADTIEIPSLPDVALKVREAIRDPEINFDTVAQIIKVDAPLSAYLLKVANSPLYRGVSPSTGISHALNRLGLNTTRNLTLSFAMRAIFKTQNKEVENILRILWIRNTYLASICSVMAEKLEGFDPERALLAGLMQDIGNLPIVNKLADYPDILADKRKLLMIFEEFCIPVGILLMNHWEFESEYLDIIHSRKKWFKEPGNEPCYADLVLISRYHSLLGSKNKKRLPRLNKLPVFKTIAGGVLTPKSSLQILQSAKEEIRSIQAMLK